MDTEHDEPLLQVPRHEFRVVDDGTKEVVEINVQLPGVSSAASISVAIKPPQTVTVTVPGRYHLELRLAMPIASTAESVRFRTKTAKLTMNCRVLTPEEAAAEAEAAAAAAAAAAAGSNGDGGSSGGEGDSSSSTHQLVSAGSSVAASEAATAAAGSSGSGSNAKLQQQQSAAVHESFFPQPTKAERKRQQQEEQRRLQQQREAEAAAAAAEEQRRRRQQEAAAAAAARKKAEEEKRAARAAEEKRRAEAAAAAKAAAAQEKQRREQQRRENKAAAEEWLSRGHAAVAQGSVDGAAKALLKATELDPDNTAGIQQLTKDLNALRQKAAAAAAAAAAAGRRGSTAAAGTAASGSTGSSSSDDEGPGPSGSNGQQERQEKKQQPPRQRQQQQWDRPGYRHGVKNEEVQDILEDYWLTQRSNGVVGWCLAFLDLLCYWWMRAAAMTAEWSDSIPRERVYCGWLGAALLWVVHTGSGLAFMLPQLLMVLWMLAWRKPLGVAAAIRRAGGDSHLEAAEWKSNVIYTLDEKEDIPRAAAKVLLAGTSGATVWGAVWATCWMSLGSHSLLGWLWAALKWVWSVVFWRPSYGLQLVGGGLGTLMCSVKQPTPCYWAIYPLQVMISSGGWQNVFMFVLTFVANLYATAVRPNHGGQYHQSVFMGTGLFLVTRTLSRCRVWALLDWVLSRLVGTLWDGMSPLMFLLLAVLSAVSTGASSMIGGVVAIPFRMVWMPLRPIWRRLLLPVLVYLPHVVMPTKQLESFTKWLCDGVQSGHENAVICTRLYGDVSDRLSSDKYSNAFWFELLLAVWLLYLVAMLSQWDEKYGREYRQQQQARKQQEERQRQQQQQQRARAQVGSDDEADSTPWGDKSSDFPMGFGPVAVPTGCEVATVVAVLQATDYYQVMGFSDRSEVTADTLKTSRRQLVLAVHPDKIGHDYPGANLAAGRVNKAFETLNNPTMRSAYDSILTNHSKGSSRGSRSAAAGGSGGIEPYSDELYERPPPEATFMCQDMACPGCRGRHTTYILPKAPFGVRWCGECKDWHPVSANEMWAHWTPGPLGMSWLGTSRLLLCIDPEGPVYDITDVFKCKDSNIHLPNQKSLCNTHHNPLAAAMAGGGRGYRGGGGGGGGGTSTARRSRKKGRRR